jgi:hypothetical protein
MTAIWQESPTDEWTLLKPTGFPDEKTLHDLVAAAPELLPLSGSPRLIVLGREVLLGSGYVDLLAIEPDGRPVIIETKLRNNTESRRAVVAQVLAYAAALHGVSAEQFEREVLARHLGGRSLLMSYTTPRRKRASTPPSSRRRSVPRCATGLSDSFSSWIRLRTISYVSSDTSRL